MSASRTRKPASGARKKASTGTTKTSRAPRKARTSNGSADPPAPDPETKKRAARIVRRLTREFPAPECALDHDTPFQLLVATILSAQCTDERVNQTTPALFAAYPDPFAMAKARPAHLEELIRSTGFFRNKAKNILGASVALVEEHDGVVPRTMDELLALPGVARKTANVVLGVAFGIAVGVVVDTHVSRISTLLELTSEKDPKKIERDLMAILPRKHWIDFSHRLILHGRKTCIARRPRCAECPIAKDCPSRQDV